MEKKKVLVKFYSELNLGDDLFLKILLERYPNTEFYLLSDDRYEKIVIKENRFKNLIIFRSKVNNSFFSKIRRTVIRKFFKSKVENMYQKNILKTNLKYFQSCDYFVSIGGSIFMEKKGGFFDQDILYYKIVKEYFDNKSIFFLGCNFGPFRTEKYPEIYKSIFSNAADVCFREEYSKSLFPDLKNVRVEPDIVFGLQTAKCDDRIKNSIGFSIISPRDLIEETTYVLKYVSLIKSYLKQGKELYLFSFCDKEGDAKMIVRILENFTSDERVYAVLYDGNIDRFLKQYAKVELMYCSRFHSMILSMLFHQNIHPIIYSKKMTNVLEDIAYKGKYTFLKDFSNMKGDVNEDFNESSYNIDKLIINSEKHFCELDKVIDF